MMSRWWSLVPALLVAAGAAWVAEPSHASPQSARAADAPKTESAQDLLKEFRRRHRGKDAQETVERVLAAVAAEAPPFAPGSETEDPRLRSLRTLAARLDAGAKESERSAFKRAVKTSQSPAGAREHPLPHRIAYDFASHRVVAVDPKDSALAKRLRAGGPVGADLVAEWPPDAVVEQLLHGCLPELEVALAAIEQRLDVVHTGDLFAQFLDAWRNSGPDGDESFYEALDRTAGTRDEVFFYDAMLGDFVGRFAGEEGKKWPLNQQHDRLVQSFLSYRQYRGFIEAAAFALVLPPDVPFPKRLARYDYPAVPPGKFSLRHQVDVLLEAYGNDAARVIDVLRAHLEEEPMPQPIWTAYDPMGSFRDEFMKLVSAAIAGTLNVDGNTLANRHADAGRALAASIRSACRAALAEK